MSKIDLKNAFRLIPVRQADWNLLGIWWHNRFFVNACLPFGLRSAPYLFNQLSIAIHWILQHSYGLQHLLHYLDDFSLPDQRIHNNVRRTYNLCSPYAATSTLPLNYRKWRAVLTSLTFLGIHLDSKTMEASISDERKLALINELTWIRTRDKCNKRQLLSLIGKLSFCCKVRTSSRQNIPSQDD